MTQQQDLTPNHKLQATVEMTLPEESDLLLLARAIDDCQTLMSEAEVSQPPVASELTEPLPSLLEQCERLINQLPSEPEPIRTIHHFACTGGSLISKCLACMPNTQLLSEVEPFSQMESHRAFFPTDLIQLLRHSSCGADVQLETEIFLAGLRALYADCELKGRRLVLRDHSHSRYCVGPVVAETPVLRALAGRIGPVRAIVTVRHPLDSFLSLEKLDWSHFQPGTLDEYCKRYLRFLDDYEGVPLFKYEDFVSAPADELRAMCEALDLPFAEGFELIFGVHRLSGDSGRSSDVVGLRDRRPVSDSLAAEALESVAYEELCKRIGYEL